MEKKKQPGKRARLSHSIQAVGKQAVQNHEDIDALADATQSTIEDVLKVTLAGLKLTIKQTDIEIERLEKQAEEIGMEGVFKVLDIEEKEERWIEHYEDAKEYAEAPWWKRLFMSRPMHTYYGKNPKWHQ